MFVTLIASVLMGTPKSGAKVPLRPLNLVPTPTRVTRLKGGFRIGTKTQIVYDASFADDRFASEQLMEEVLTDVGIRIEPGTSKSIRAITLRRLPKPISDQDFGQGYRLVVTPISVTVSANTADGIFYGVQTLKQLIRANRRANTIPACRIVDWPKLKYRGWQHDISRGPIPTYAFLMKEIRTLAEFKLNMMTLYTEDVFKLKKHSDIAPADGITAEEVAELSSYGKQFHVDVVGNFQSFGHFSKILKIPAYQEMAETPSVISPAKESSYKFLSDVYSEIAPAYSSKFFNINCDEVSGLGKGPSKDLVQKIGVGGVYAQHINRVVDLVHQYGKTPMMWGDIALNYPDIVPKLPKDLIVLPWAYDGRAIFDSEILPFTKFGLQFMVCPGVSCWNEIWPNLDNATVNISNFTRDGAKFGAIGMLNTEWDDDGTNFFNDNWYEFIWGAECSWKPAIALDNQDPDVLRKSRLDRFNEEFQSVFYGVQGSDVTAALLKLSDLRKNPLSGQMRSKAMWRDPLATLSDIGHPPDIASFVSDSISIAYTLRQAKAKATHNAPTLDYAIFASREARYLGDSLVAVQEVQKRNLAPIKALEQEVTELKDWYTELWQRENCAWWLDKNIAKFEDLTKRIEKL